MKEAMEGSQHNVWELSVDGVGSFMLLGSINLHFPVSVLRSLTYVIINSIV